MKKISMNVGARLGIGFGLVIFMLIALMVSGLIQLKNIGSLNAKIVEKDWVKADAANTVNVTIRENARQTMQLFITTDKSEIAAIHARIAGNIKIISDALETLNQLLYLPEGRAMLAKIKETRAQYVASFTKVGKFLEQDNREEAIRLMNLETLPILNALQDSIKEMSDLQKRIVVASSADIKGSIDSAFNLILLFGGLAVALGLTAAFIITRGLLRQLGGEPDYAAGIADKIAQGDLTVAIATKNSDQSSLLFSIKCMRDSLATIVAQVHVGTDTIATASSQIASGNLDLSSRTEEQASSLEETASSMEELTSTVKQNADNARQANSLAVSASEVAVKGGAVVAQVVDTMGSINDSAKKIVDIIGVIDGIAFQTNILALNAAVEAARAGEQGRGFAVVAAEVRNLAQRSASAAKEIKLLIGDSVEKVDLGAKLVDQAGATMHEIVASVKRVTDIMGEITSASQEQTAGIEQINQAITQMDEVTQQNAALVEEAAAAAQSLQDQAAGLSKVVSVFVLKQDDSRINSKPMSGHAPSQVTELPSPSKRLPKVGAQVVRAPAPRMLKTGTDNADWEEF